MLKTVLPPHGFTYATVYFHPKAIQDYDCIFEAAVDGSGNKSKPLSFQLTGAGNLPRASLSHPSLKDEAGFGILNFRSLPVGQSQKLPLVLRNDGDLQAKIKLPWGKSIKSPFSLFLKDSKKSFEEAELSSGESLNLEVEFRPETIDQFEEILQFEILHNEFDTIVVKLFGECFNQAVVIDNLPGLPLELSGINSISVISFDDLALRDQRKVFKNSKYTQNIFEFNMI